MSKSKSYIDALIACIIYILCFWGITEASDFYSYTLMFEGKMESRDPAFSFLAEIFAGYGLDFLALYKFHIVLIAVFTVTMIRQFGVNTLLITVLLIIANYVDMASQIRFFAALPLSIISLYLFFVDKKIVMALLFAVLSVSFHQTVLILFIFFVLVYILRKKALKEIIAIGFISNLFLFLMVNEGIISFNEQYDSYFEDRNITSVAGAIYSLFPLLIIVGFIVYTHIKLARLKSKIMQDKTFVFLYVLSITPLLLLMPSFVMQTIIRRFIITLFPIWVIYFLYIRKNYKAEYAYLHLGKLLIASIALRLTWVWIMPLTGIVPMRFYEKLHELIINYRW